MESKIRIEVDFDNGNRPVIEILPKNSDDVRDKLIKSFLQSFHGNCWCRIRWDGGQNERVRISALTEANMFVEVSDIHQNIFAFLTNYRSFLEDRPEQKKEFEDAMATPPRSMITNGELVKELMKLNPDLPAVFIDINDDSEDAAAYQIVGAEQNEVRDADGEQRNVISLLNQAVSKRKAGKEK